MQSDHDAWCKSLRVVNRINFIISFGEMCSEESSVCLFIGVLGRVDYSVEESSKIHGPSQGLRYLTLGNPWNT